MAEPFRIQREADGAVFEYDSPIEVPAGFKTMGQTAPQAGPLSAPQETKPELPAWASPKTLLGLPMPFETRVNRPQMELGASMLAPGKSILGRAAGQATVSGLSELGHGGGPLQAAKKAAVSGITTGLVGGAGKAVGALTSKANIGKHSNKVASEMATEVKKRVPWFSEFKPDNAGLREMLYGQNGWNALHEGYDESLKKVIARGAGKTLALLPEEADILKLKSVTPSADPARAAEIAKSLGVTVDHPQAQAIIAAFGLGPKSGTHIMVDAGDVAKAITGRWKKNPELYRKIVNMLDDEGIGDPAARAAYKTAMGLRDYLSQTGSFTPGGMDLMKAQSGLLDKTGDQLMRRQLGGFADILAPGGKMIEKGSMRLPGAIVGGAIGGAGGNLLGPLGSAGGAMGGAWLGARGGGMIPYYKGLPPAPTAGVIQELLARLGGNLSARRVPENGEQIPFPQ